MPTTAAGTPYTVYTATVGSHGVAYWAVADAHVADTDIPTVLYAHGAGGASNQFATLSGWTGIRNWLIDNGWAWVEGSGGSSGGAQNWGNLAARAAYPAYLSHVEGILSIGVVCLLGRSMGGLITAWLCAHDAGVRYSGWINNSGVSTWLHGDDSNDDAVPLIDRSTRTYFTESVITDAWGVADLPTLSTALTAADAIPEAWDASVWSGKKILSVYGDADTTVPWSPRGAARLREVWAGQPEVDDVKLVPGGTHATGSYQQTAAMSAFLLGLLDDEPEPIDAKYLNVVAAHVVYGREMFPVLPL